MDTINVILAVVAGTLLLISVLLIDSIMLKWLAGFIVGEAAATVQSGTALTRLPSSATTGGTTNSLVATGEHIAVFGTTIISLNIPLIVVSILLTVVIILIIIFRLIQQYGINFLIYSDHK